MLTRLTFLSLLLLGSGCSTYVASQRPGGKRSLFVVSEADRPLFPVLILAPSAGVVEVALQNDRLRIVDDSGDEFVAVLEATKAGFTVEGWRHDFLNGKRFVVGRGGRFMFLEDRDYVAWANGRTGWWDQPERWTNCFQAQLVKSVKS